MNATAMCNQAVGGRADFSLYSPSVIMCHRTCLECVERSYLLIFRYTPAVKLTVTIDLDIGINISKGVLRPQSSRVGKTTSAFETWFINMHGVDDEIARTYHVARR